MFAQPPREFPHFPSRLLQKHRKNWGFSSRGIGPSIALLTE
jgi:hypothetical protein